DRMAVDRRTRLQEILDDVRESEESRKPPAERPRVLGPVWKEYSGGPVPLGPPVHTGVEVDVLRSVLEAATSHPDDFHPHPKIRRLLEQRRAMAAGEKPLDWAAAEALALGTLAAEGHPIRFSGQDCQRGTFSQRHAALHDVENGRVHVPLQHVAPQQGVVEFVNSPLSEMAALGFEYGYSLTYPEALVAWEAQFGDFCNVAQPIIDQFIASGESKWGMLSGLILLLPHGLEGMGPEHSSARLERFLNLAAEDNLQIANPTTPGQYFHVLRRQVLRHWRKPLVLMTPKSLLRHPECVSSLDDLAAPTFQTVLADDGVGADVSRIVLCSGKVYYDLLEERRRLERHDVALVRLEQLYPFPERSLMRVLEDLPADVPLIWAQEEPANMGVWPFLRYRGGGELLGRPLLGACRPEAASPATGSAAAHHVELRHLLDAVYGDLDETRGLITGTWIALAKEME
ncbi:2-oxoglutarate dehydrogenase E1 component, partial [bacterium]|nr:2-oxoglutarate dehydrogenase E1 component [bacterium]